MSVLSLICMLLLGMNVLFYALVLLLPSQELGSYYGTGLTVSTSHYEGIEPATHSKIDNKNAFEHTGLSLRAGCRLISPTERELKSG